MKALIIDEPWIGLILRGEKAWEMRKTPCHHRGQIALIKKGSGQVVGVAEITGSLAPLEDADSYRAAEARHRIPSSRQAQALADGWRTPWVIEKASALTRPIAYSHPSGAVIWVKLSADVTTAVAAQLGSLGAHPAVPHALETEAKPNKLLKTIANALPTDVSSPSDPAVRNVTVTGGNLRHKHIYLPLDFFPEDAIGGSNKGEKASRTISVTFCPGVSVQTDIDRTKRILRARAQVGDFLVRSGVRDGEAVRITRTSPYEYEFSRITDV